MKLYLQPVRVLTRGNLILPLIRPGGVGLTQHLLEGFLCVNAPMMGAQSVLHTTYAIATCVSYSVKWEETCQFFVA